MYIYARYLYACVCFAECKKLFKFISYYVDLIQRWESEKKKKQQQQKLAYSALLTI